MLFVENRWSLHLHSTHDTQQKHPHRTHTHTVTRHHHTRSENLTAGTLLYSVAGFISILSTVFVLELHHTTHTLQHNRGNRERAYHIRIRKNILNICSKYYTPTTTSRTTSIQHTHTRFQHTLFCSRKQETHGLERLLYIFCFHCFVILSRKFVGFRESEKKTTHERIEKKPSHNHIPKTTHYTSRFVAQPPKSPGEFPACVRICVVYLCTRSLLCHLHAALYF